MPRRARISKRDLLPDPKYDSILATKFINYLMRRGKRSIAERILYNAIDLMSEKTGQEGLAIMNQAVSNVKPNLEVKSRRVGGATYQVPVEVKPDRKTALALRWIKGLETFGFSAPAWTMRCWTSCSGCRS